jgi:hypothetical protein
VHDEWKEDSNELVWTRGSVAFEFEMSRRKPVITR